MSWLVKNKGRLRGIFLTHGHEDHIGALPYLLEKLNAPVYATPLPSDWWSSSSRSGSAGKIQAQHVTAGETVQAGCFKVEFIHVNHSIADSVAFAVTTPVGVVVQTGDFKIDVTPLSGQMTDLTRFGELGKAGVLALLMDSTNVERPGWCPSESRVYERFDDLFKDCDKRIIVTTFASNVDRIRQIIDLAAKYKRKVGITAAAWITPCGCCASSWAI
jgi:ribonuclease J